MQRLTKVAVIGAGVMGSRIACQFANAGCTVLLLDLPSKGGLPKNQNVHQLFQKTCDAKPNALYAASFSNRIALGNTEDDLPNISTCQWILEAVSEDLSIKKKLFSQINRYRAKDALVTSNTSGIPIDQLLAESTDDFKAHFAITHFFNPPRYLRLLEVVPSPALKRDSLDFLVNFATFNLGKEVVFAKNTPAFIGNRIGIFSLMSTLAIAQDFHLSIPEIDYLTGELMGRPKSATFRTADLVGLDILCHLGQYLYDACPKDKARSFFKPPAILAKLLSKQWLGNKTGQGFYQKRMTQDGTKQFYHLDLNDFTYQPPQKITMPFAQELEGIRDVKARYLKLLELPHKIGAFYQKLFAYLLAYVAAKVPEITDDFKSIDKAMRTGFGWEHGPFEIWDCIGWQRGIDLIKQEKLPLAAWVRDLKGERFYPILESEFNNPNAPSIDKAKIKTLWSNQEASIQEVGDGILNVCFHSFLNCIGLGTIEALNRAIDMATDSYKGLLIANDAPHFSIGVNLKLGHEWATDKNFKALENATLQLQKVLMRLRYCPVPVVVAPRGMTFGGACELSMHADRVVATAETYTGLVEFGVGLIPAGAGTKEMVQRIGEDAPKKDFIFNRFERAFTNIAMGKVSTSAEEAFELGYHRRYKDSYVVAPQTQWQQAKQTLLEMVAFKSYIPPVEQPIKVWGQSLIGFLEAGIEGMFAGKYITAYDGLMARKLAYVMAGGNLSSPTMVSADYLLDLEREAVLSLLGHQQTVDRIGYMLKTGKPLRN